MKAILPLRCLPLLCLSLLSTFATGCDEEKPAAEGAKSAKPAAPPQPTAKTTPTPTVAKPPEPKHDCPEGSEGVGSFDKPCDAKGDARLMEVVWNGKMTDKGPPFKVHNSAKLPIIYGKMAAYFYDKDGKQLNTKDSNDKESPMKWCFGKIFEGPMKADEKAVITFSCVKKEDVPEGTTKIEAEMQIVGFDGGDKVDFYWRNKDLTPDARPPVGDKKAKKGK
jgi:hypothetical protein